MGECTIAREPQVPGWRKDSRVTKEKKVLVVVAILGGIGLAILLPVCWKNATGPRRDWRSVSMRGVHGPVAAFLGATSPAPQIGKGYDPDRDKALAFCIEATDPVTLGGSTALGVKSEAWVFDSTQKLQQKLEVGNHMAFDFGFSLNTAGNFLLSQDVTQYSTTVVVHVQVLGEQQSLRRFLLKQWVVDELTRDPAYADGGFREACGSRFVSGVRTGGELYAMVTIRSHTANEKLHIDQRLGFGGAGVSVGVAAVADVVNDLERKDYTMTIYSTGAAARTLPDFSSLMKYADDFPNAVAQAGGTPVTIELADYGFVENYPDLKSPRNEQYRRVMEELGRSKVYIKSVRTSCLYIQQAPEEFTDVDICPARH